MKKPISVLVENYEISTANHQYIERQIVFVCSSWIEYRKYSSKNEISNVVQNNNWFMFRLSKNDFTLLHFQIFAAHRNAIAFNTKHFVGQ